MSSTREIGNLNIKPFVSRATIGSSGGIARAAIHSDSRAMGAGHGGASGRFNRLDEVAIVYAFALWAVGLAAKSEV